MSKKSDIITTEFSAFDFVDLGDRDYIGARLLYFCGKSLSRLSAYHAQQAIEKYLKALAVQETGSYLKTHPLVESANFIKEFFPQLVEDHFLDSLRELDTPEQIARYGPFSNFDPLSKKIEGKFETKDVFVWGGDHIKKLDEVVNKIRSLVNFEGNLDRDSLQAIYEGSSKHQIILEWKLPNLSIQDILITDNDFYRKV